MKTIWMIATLSVWGLRAFGGGHLPEVGKPLPAFELNHVTHYHKSRVTADAFKGRWLVLDFWFTGCTACIKSFPKMSALQAHFKDRIQFIAVGLKDGKRHQGTEKLFESLREKMGLQLVAAYDSALFKQWKITAMPYLVIVNPEGIVHSITDGRDMTKEKLEELVNHKPAKFFLHHSAPRPAFSVESNALKPQDILCRSVLTRWNGERQNGGYDLRLYAGVLDRDSSKAYELAMVHLGWLYNLAYHGRSHFRWPGDSLYGKVSPYPVLEIMDAAPFAYSYSVDVGKGMYNYHLRLPPPQTVESVKEAMQQDLKRAFGYRVSVETRSMPVWKLVAKPGTAEKLRTKGGEPVKPWTRGSTAAGFEARNVTMKVLFKTLIELLSDGVAEPFIDATGIVGNVDFSIQADMTDLEAVGQALRKQGLDLVKGEKDMKVLVIRDP